MASDESPQSTTNDALKTFFPGQTFSLKPLDDRPVVTFTVSKLFTPVTKSIVVLAKPDPENAKDEEPPEVIVKIYDPRYLDDRISKIPSIRSHPWNFAHERAAALARPKNATLSEDELGEAVYDAAHPEELSDSEEDGSSTGCDPGEHDDPTPSTPSDEYYALCEEQYHRLMTYSYTAELAAYKRLHDLQGSVIPRFHWAGTFIPPRVERASDDGPLVNVEERAIRPPALVLEHVPSIGLNDIPPASITSELREQVISALESFSPRGVLHGDVTLSNIRFSPPTEPTRAFMIDFGCSSLRDDEDDEAYWEDMGKSDVWWAGELLDEKRTGKRSAARTPKN